ncbi:hypothetical protein QQ045_005238 [Rhodiola kirilowii]
MTDVANYTWTRYPRMGQTWPALNGLVMWARKLLSRRPVTNAYIFLGKKRERILSQLDIIRADKFVNEVSVAALHRTLSEINAGIAAASEKIVSEEEKFKKWRIENIHRKHNYITFLFKFLKLLAEKKKLKSADRERKAESQSVDCH